MTTDGTIDTTMTVKRSSTVEGRNGPQWALTVTWPWTIGQHTDTVWLEKSEYPDEPTGGTYHVAVAHRTVKNKADGGQHDGSQRWMWNWQILRFIDQHAPAPTAASAQAEAPTTAATNPQITEPVNQRNGVSTPATWQEQNIRGYDLGMAFNKAVDIVTTEGYSPEVGPISTSRIREWRDQLLQEVIMVPPSPPHWCYKHGVQRIQSAKTQVWGHVLEDKTVWLESGLP